MQPVVSPMWEDNAKVLASYWGKADPEVALRGADHHTVLAHSLDVAACAFILVDRNPVLRDRVATFTGMAPGAVATTFAAVCALHDVGKIDTRFQRKAPAIADALRAHTANLDAGKYDHGTEGFRQIEDDEDASRQIHELLGTAALPLLRAVCGHHGTLPTRDEPDPSRSRLPPSVRREDARARAAFADIVVAFFASRGAMLPWPSAVTGALVQRLAGLCAVADWLGSNVDYFPYQPGPLLDVDAYWGRACLRASECCAHAGLLRAAATAASFSELFPGYAPRDVQLLTELVGASTDGPALVIVEAEMGKGKTEAALSLASRFLASGVGEGVTVALPTMATSNAMFSRVESVAPRLFESAEVQLALAHGRASRQPLFQALVQRGLRARDLDAPEASVTCARWLLNKKRILLAQLGVGTIDQALQAALVVRHQFVRMFGLSRNVVIIDEVHAYDAYMEVLLEHLLQWLGVLGVPVILLSATLPSERRAALARAWRGSDPFAADDVVPADDLEAATLRPYPLVSVTSPTETRTYSSQHEPSTRVIDLQCAEKAEDDDAYVDDVASRLIEAARRGARVVWIRNTVREAQRAFRAVAARADGVEHLLFHARFRGCDRARIEQSVLERFGKAAPASGRILIATQVVEQSLDLDFDEMHTDLAPVDLLFQRVGRLHRHDRPRLATFERPRLIVHVPSPASVAALRFGPSSYVYDPGTLWLANRALRSRDSLRLPADIRPLVEESYHPASRAALLPEAGPKLMAAEQARATELQARRTKARRCCIPPTSADADGSVALPDDDDAVQAFTRDGTSATVLPFWWSPEGARSLDASSDAAAWALDAGRSDAWQLATELLDQTLSLPARREAEAIVSPGERVAWVAWEKSFRRFADESGLGRRLVPLPMRRTGVSHKGWLRMDGKQRRVLYSPTVGLLMLSEKDEEQAR